MTDDLKEKKALARTLVSLRFPIDNPAFNISAALDEPFERIALADFYNGPAAAWLRANTRWQWLDIQSEELVAVNTVRELGRICLAHLAPQSPAVDATIADIT